MKTAHLNMEENIQSANEGWNNLYAYYFFNGLELVQFKNGLPTYCVCREIVAGLYSAGSWTLGSYMVLSPGVTAVQVRVVHISPYISPVS